jgi:hypothetical protein
VRATVHTHNMNNKTHDEMMKEFKTRAACLEAFFGKMEVIHVETVKREEMEEESLGKTLTQVTLFSVTLMILTSSFVFLVN